MFVRDPLSPHVSTDFDLSILELEEVSLMARKFRPRYKYTSGLF